MVTASNASMQFLSSLRIYRGVDEIALVETTHEGKSGALHQVKLIPVDCMEATHSAHILNNPPISGKRWQLASVASENFFPVACAVLTPKW